MTDLANLERLRQALEANIAKLRKSLLYWQTWEIEYESFKEELERAEDPTAAEMLTIGLDLADEIVDEKEIKSLLHGRTRAQVITQLRGRIDTGQKNAATVQKQLATAEEKLEKVMEVTEEQEMDSGDHQMDIFEELDDDGNVISSRVVDASKDRQQLQNVLKSKGLVEETKEAAKTSASVSAQATSNDKGKKVAFAPPTTSISLPERAPPANKMHPTQRMLVVDDNENVIDSRPLELIHPRGPSQDEEIEYLREARANAQEIAPIVASFDIETDSDSDADTDMDDADSYGSENEYGMGNIGSELTDDYKAQMEELMKKHAVAMENAGPNFDPDVMQKLEGAHRDAGLVAKSHAKDIPHENAQPKQKSGKGVRFAEELDVSPAPERGGSRDPPPPSGASATQRAETSFGCSQNPAN